MPKASVLQADGEIPVVHTHRQVQMSGLGHTWVAMFEGVSEGGPGAMFLDVLSHCHLLFLGDLQAVLRVP